MVLIVKWVSEINAMSILCILRNVCSSSLWLVSPLAFQSTIRSELFIGGDFVDNRVQ
jgi:hypothetical protein